jgi:hypothetical protein
LPARDAVSQTNGIGAKQQRLGEPPETDASGQLLTASAGSVRLICLDADRRSWQSITNNFRSFTFVKQPPSRGEAAGPAVRAASACSDRTHRGSMQAKDGVTEQNFRKRDEQKAGSASM